MPTKPDAPSLSKGTPAAAPPVVEITDLQVQFAIRSNALARLLGRTSGVVKAVDGVNLTLARGEVLGLVGESGSGKSTLGRSLLGLVRPTSGSIRFHGGEIAGLPESKMRPLRRKLQMVFQDPHASLNPSMTVGRSISDALRIHGLHPGTTQRRAAVVEALERVGLAPASRFIDKYPRELSGGQKQRAVIARAIALGPELLVADEPISMLDMSVRAKILGLLEELKRDLGLTYVYITHDLASARFFCDRVAIMYLGRIVEIGSVEEIFDNPRHPYTKALLQAVPDPDPSRGVARELPRGEIPDAASPPRGCAFHPRCPEAFAPCGWESRDVRMVLEQRWTTVPVAQYETESTLVPDAEQLTATPDTLRAGGSAADLVGVLEDERTTRPDDPLWTGVQGISADGRDVRLELRPRFDPRLLPVSGTSVEVACHRHHDPGTSQPA